jgi:transmembrane sensor
MTRRPLRLDILRIFKKYQGGTASPEEATFTEAAYRSLENQPDILAGKNQEEVEHLESRMENRLRLIVGEKSTETAKTPLFELLWFRFAASISLLIACGCVIYTFKASRTKVETVTLAQPMAPGYDQATLTLGDGSQIALNHVDNGILAMQGGTSIHKPQNGLIVYSGKNEITELIYNTISAPVGGKYSVVLPDGTQAWLNAESSIRFPTTFPVNERSVSISGEVYFEVTKDLQRPFLVTAPGKQEVKVLGTHFNVNAYGDEKAVTTTVLEGRVEVAVPGNKKVQLKSGEQSSTSGPGHIAVAESINTEEAIAWKNGMFQFDNADIRVVMRQLSRWYNVEVVYEGTISNKQFSGKISRSVTAAEALEILRFTGVNFRIENPVDAGKRSRIVVMQ